MDTNDTYKRLNVALVHAGMDPVKAMKGKATVSEFRDLCLELGTTPGAVCEAAGL